MEIEKKSRRFSLEEDFMNYSTNDLLYGIMRSLSTTKPKSDKLQSWQEYLLFTQFKKNKKFILNILQCSEKTLTRHLNRLIERGLVKQLDDSYFFPFEYYSRYEIIEQEMLQYLIDTRSSNAIRIYIYLLNKYKWKKIQQEEYEFTIKEIKQAMGYSTSTKTAETMIRNVLESLQREGIINYIQTYKDIIIQDIIVTMPIYKLTFVATSKKLLGKK